jgi:hypothetical protein
MYVSYAFHNTKYFKENTNEINKFVQNVVANVKNGIGFGIAIEIASNNVNIDNDFKKIAILMAAINILKNQNASIELNEEIRNIIENIEKFIA